MRRAVDDEVPGAIAEETSPAAVRRVPPGFWMRFLYMPLVRLASNLNFGPFFSTKISDAMA